MNGGTRSVTPLDIALILLVALAAAASGIAIYGNRSDETRLVIESPAGAWIYGLDAERTVEIPGPLGATTVRIGGGEARFINSPCPNKTCLASPPVAHAGDWNACLPNRVIIRVEGSNAVPVDAVGY